MKIDINKITKALSQVDFCDSMKDIGFELFGYDDYFSDDYYFENSEEGLIIYYSPNSKEYTIYNRTRKVKTQPVEVQER